MLKPVKIEIQELGPIRNSEIEIAQLLLFTGESGLGKSYVSFLCYYLYHMLCSTRFTQYFKERQIDVVRLWNETQSDKTIVTFQVSDIIAWLEQDAVRYVGWLIGNPGLKGKIKFHLPIEETEIPFEKHEEIAGLEGNEEHFWTISYKDNAFNVMGRQSNVFDFYFARLLSSALCTLLWEKEDNKYIQGFFDTILLPPSRGALMDCVSRPKFKAGMYEEFYNLKELLLSSRFPGFTPGEEFLEMARKCIQGNLSSENNEINYTTDGDVTIPLSAAASSVKEIAPYLMWLTSTPVVNTGILFEEPEAHLHPSRQQRVVDTFSYLIHMKCYLVITTHSDYILKRINQLIRLNRLIFKSENSKTKLETKEVMDKMGITFKSLFDISCTRAYLLKRNADGTSRIERIDYEDGISFDSFDTVLDTDMELDDEIDRLSRLEC